MWLTHKIETLLSSSELRESLKKSLSGKVDFRNDSMANLNSMIGKVSFTEEEFAYNLDTFLTTVDSRRSEKFRGEFFKNVYIKSTEGPSFQLMIDYVDPRSKTYFIHNMNELLDFDLRSNIEEEVETEGNKMETDFDVQKNEKAFF
jgi:hypothetical protein